ncbi:hypothetical protein B0H11DRAFT_2289307 [Mycena galericulata]|nr:hypothetical protein B0H11DRAFT_2289307 [Mycena galericulata]
MLVEEVADALVEHDRQRNQMGFCIRRNFIIIPTFRSGSTTLHSTHSRQVGFDSIHLFKRMRRRYTDRLRLRFPMPQLDIGSLAPGEPAIVTNDSPNDVAAPPVAPQDNAPQKVHALTSTVALATGTSVLTGESARTDSPSVETFASSSALQSVSMISSWSAMTASSSPVTSSTTTSSSLASSTIATSSLHPSSIPSRVALVTSSTSQTPSSSSLAPSSIVSASASASSDAAPYTLTHGAPFYASLALGALILIACLAVVIAFLIRVRARRRDRAALTHIAWDPVVPGGGGGGGEKDSTAGTRTLADLDLVGTDASLAGDRDVGEPKRDTEASFLTLSRRGSLAHPHSAAADENNFNSDAYSYSYADPNAGSGVGGAPLDAPYAYPHQQHPNPFVESAYYYAPHQVPPLADSAAYPLPPFPASASDTRHSVAPRLSFTSGPYPTARPLPAYLADRDPHAHRASVSTNTTGTYRSAASTSWSERQRERQSRSAASSRSGSVRSAQLMSASTLRVANGGGSRASTALGYHENELGHEEEEGGPAPVHGRDKEKGFLALDTWRTRRPSESFAARAGGVEGWRPLQPHEHEQQQQQQGWGETLRASVLGAFHAVTGAASPLGASANTANSNAASASGEDALTRAPTTGRARREAGWARFAQAERARSVSSARSIRTDASGGMGGMYMDLARPPALGLGLHPQYSANTNPFGSTTGSDADAASVRTDNSRAPLVDGHGGIRRPRPAVVSRVSQESGSVYSVGSAVPPQGYNGYGYGYGARAG